MNTEGFKRKLTAILSADVVGYSRLMRDDEEATVRTLNAYKEMIFDLIERNKGRLVDSTGDNLLAEFASVVDAIRCGVQIQEDVKAKNEGLPENRKMEFRIGINLGDVIQERDRIYGDGVNVAARIESLADPSGICISRSAYDQVKRKLNFKYEYLGEHEVKNIDEPVRVYKVSMESVSDKALQEERSREPASEERKTYPLSDKPSIAVLPFVNMSNDPEQEYFSDGMAEELIGALAKLDGLKVISRTSAFHFKGKDTDLCTIGEKLKIDHVLEGSVRKAGNRLRISTQLIRVDDDTHLWADTYDRELEDVFAIQDEISQAVVENLKVKLLGKKTEPIIKTHTENMDAYESFIRGRYYYNSFTVGSMEKALEYYKQAVSLDPNYAPAHSAIAEWYCMLPYMGQEASREDVYTKAKKAITKALEIDNNLPEAHATLGLIRWIYEWDWKGAEHALSTAITLNPGSSKSHYDYAMYLAGTGRNPDKAISESRKAVELDPLSGRAHFILGISLYQSGQLDQAIEKLRYTRDILPKTLPSIGVLVSAYTKKGMFKEALIEIKKGLGFFPNNPQLLQQMGTIYALRGEKEKTQAILDVLLERLKKEYEPLLPIALTYAALGEMDKVFEYLEKAYEKRAIYLATIKLMSSSSSRLFHTDPRFTAFLKKMGLED